jgi:hypothetical protein
MTLTMDKESLLETSSSYRKICDNLVRAVQVIPEWHNHGEKVEREFEERILEWNKGPRTKARWEELEFKLVGRKCNGQLIQMTLPKIQYEWDSETIGWKIVASCRFQCQAAPNYQLDPDVIQYSATKISQRDLRYPIGG